jgi:hypothetical protein
VSEPGVPLSRTARIGTVQVANRRPVDMKTAGSRASGFGLRLEVA